MAPPNRAGLFQVGVHILNTVIDKVTGTLLALTGDSYQASPDSTRVEWWQHVGFLSRPPAPVAGTLNTTEGITIRRGDQDACIASRDLRGQQLAGTLDYGETCVYAPGTGTAQGRILLKKNGTVSLVTLQGNAAGGQTCTIQVNADGSINIASPNGAIVIGTTGSISAVSKGGAGLSLDASGNAALMGKQAMLNGATVSLGSTPGTGVATLASMTPLLTALTSYVTAVNAFIAAVVPTTGVADPTGSLLSGVQSAGGALLPLLPLPTNFSQSVTASWP